jgi:hypothetical protein
MTAAVKKAAQRTIGAARGNKKTTALRSFFSAF